MLPRPTCRASASVHGRFVIAGGRTLTSQWISYFQLARPRHALDLVLIKCGTSEASCAWVSVDSGI